MRRRLFMLSLSLAACGAPAAATPVSPSPEPMKPANPTNRPKDFALVYAWREGSLPPPHHYSYEVRASGTNGEVHFTPDYKSAVVPTWVMPFPLTAAQLDSYFALAREKGLFTTAWEALKQPPVGGANSDLSVTADGRQYKIPPFVIEAQRANADALRSAARALVPAEIWTMLNTMRDDYKSKPRG